MKLADKGKNPLNAINCLFKGFTFLPRKELRKYLLMPLLINIVLYSAVLVLGYYYLSDLIDHFIPGWLSWLEWLLWPLFFVSFLITGFFTFTVLANLIAAPFYNRLSAKTVELLSGQASDAVEPPLMKVMSAELKRAGYMVSRMIPLLILFIIPVVNVIAPIVWALFGAWSMALEFMAYPLENRGLLFAEQKQMLKDVGVAGLSFGGLTVMGLSVPLFNLIVSPAAVIGATVYVHEYLDQE
nr:sulfate transporter CysZ [Methylomarinum sp. Ch1-1]MDP4520006.1 sulfate transporter CysZ [Methylomarinum sp. Ch1-1]